MTKIITNAEFNAFTTADLKRVVIANCDGSDISLYTLYDIIDDYEPELTYSELINVMYEEYGGNLLEIKWIEDNELHKITFK